MLLRLLDALPFPQNFLVFGHFDSFDNVGQVFCRMSLSFGWSDVFLMIRFGLWMLGGRPQK